MATSLAAQLSAIAANSENSLNLKAQRVKHSKSLIFEPRIAASQSFETIYTLCHEGFQELCLLDKRFLEFQKDVFSEQSQQQDRSQMTAIENSELDRRLEAFLGLVGGSLRLSPAIRAVEWLVRRFRIQECNTSFFLLTFLPYHTLPIFATMLSILPENILHDYKFLQPYVRSLANPPRHAIVQAATNNAPFAAGLNAYVLRICQARQQYQALLAFWAGIMTEAVSGVLDKARSGRKIVQQQNQQDAILMLLPTLNEGLAMKKVPDLRLGCYMLVSVVASKGVLGDTFVTAMMEAVVLGWTEETLLAGLVCLSLLAQYREAKQLTNRITKELLKIRDLPNILVQLSQQRRVDKLASGYCIALVDRLRKFGDTAGLPIIQKIVENQLLSDPQSTVVVKALILAAYQSNGNDDIHRDARSHLALALVSLTQLPGRIGIVVRGALTDSDVDMDELESKLQTSIRPLQVLDIPSEDVAIENSDTAAPTSMPTFTSILEQLPKRTVTESSFLAHNTSHIYRDLCQAFLASIPNKSDTDMFDEIPILRREFALEDTLYLSFYIKTWCGPYPAIARTSALHMATRRLCEGNASGIDFQAIIPYLVVALGDVSTKVRRAAAELLLTVQKLYPQSLEPRKKGKKLPRWAASDLYSIENEDINLNWLSPEALVRLLSDILAPALEECVLDRKYIESVFQKALNSSRNGETPKKQETVKLSQSTRGSILSFLASHTIYTPLFSVKMGLLACLSQVRSVGGTTRTRFLLPALQQWASLDNESATKYCQAEHLDPIEMDDAFLSAIIPNDKDGICFLGSIIKGDIAQGRVTLLRAVLKRLHALWPFLDGEVQLDAAQTLLDSALSEPDAHNKAQEINVEGSLDLLRSTPLSTDVLSMFLEQLPTTTKLADKPPATKRRRTSHGEIARISIQDSKHLTEAIKKVTFVLQLVDSSDPGNHPELLRGLFSVLAELQHFKAQISSELAYLQSLTLGSLLAIIKAYKRDSLLKLDRSAVRADLLVDCVQKTLSPQVQNAALLLIASLADTAPELVLHSVMPIFTFMGSSVFRQNDEYSAHVISQTIREVIPPLIASLRKEKGNPVTGAAELLLSFVAAYEHIPSHRRQGIFTSLVQTMGPEDFLFALLAMLVDKYGSSEAIKTFCVELSGSFSVEIQLQTAVKQLDLVADILKPKPIYSATLLNASDDEDSDPYQLALDELSLLPDLLCQKKLVIETENLLGCDDMDAARIRELYSALLENILALSDTLKDQKQVQYACGEVLESVLGLLSTSEFVKSVEDLLHRPNESLRRKVLRSLEARIDSENPSDAISRVAMLGCLPQLTAIIRESKDVLYKHTAVTCVDKIAEKYGKKDLEAVAASAETIASKHCLGQSDERLRVMALLCLASLIEILQEGIVFVLPTAIPNALDYMNASVRDKTKSQKLHNAGFAFISALAHYLPYMLSGVFLDNLLEVSCSSAEAGLDEEADKIRVQCLQLAAKKIDAKNMFGALEKSWSRASSSGSLALHEYLDVLSTTIDSHPKSVVTKHSPLLAKIFHNAFDIRRQWTLTGVERHGHELISEIEDEVNQVAISMIYKFNDATFRPIFIDLIEWASKSLPKKDRIGRDLRLQSIYGFMAVFFDNLKSIVTSYATYLLDNAVDVLKTLNPKSDTSKELWSRVLRTMVSCFKHDQDDFWQSPSHFDAIAPVLCAQFVYASSMPLVRDLVPAIVDLAVAADSSDHHKELNSAILKHMRSESASVRLAAVKCEQEITDRLGEEWLSMLPEMLPFISELQEDDDEAVEKETHRWIVKIESVLGESLDAMLQ